MCIEPQSEPRHPGLSNDLPLSHGTMQLPSLVHAGPSRQSLMGCLVRSGKGPMHFRRHMMCVALASSAIKGLPRMTELPEETRWGGWRQTSSPIGQLPSNLQHGLHTITTHCWRAGPLGSFCLVHRMAVHRGLISSRNLVASVVAVVLHKS